MFAGWLHRLMPETQPTPTRSPCRRYVDIDYRLERSRRRTISLLPTPQGLVVKAPLTCPQREIEQAILERRPWIQGRIASLRQRLREYFDPRPGGHILFRGARLPLRLVQAAHDSACFSPETCELTSRDGSIPLAAIEAELMRLAAAMLPRLARDLAAQAGIDLGRVCISRAETLWGSCTVKGDLRLNRRLLQLPEPLMRHIIAHELAHILEFNHSRRFWSVVARLDPHWREHREEIKRYSVVLWPWGNAE